jgi:predicted ABC-type ATPase
MKTYTIIAGVNGAGKSSLLGVLKAERSDLGFTIDTDKIAFANKFNALEAGKAAIKMIDDFISTGQSFSQEKTLEGQKSEVTIKIAKAEGYYIRMFYVGVGTAKECMKRIKNRVEKGGHNIQTEDVSRVFNSRFDSVLKILPFCDEVIFYDNENGFAKVAEYKGGELTCDGEIKPAWLKELQVLLSGSALLKGKGN